MKKLIIALLMVCPNVSLGHTMSPASQVVQSVGLIHEEDYTLRNEYDFPATFVVIVKNKDGSLANNWRTEKKEFKLLPNSERTFTLRFKVEDKRKLLVCTRLKTIGKNNENPSIISTLCSRLIIHSAR